MKIKPIKSKLQYRLYVDMFVKIAAAEEGTPEWEQWQLACKEGTPEWEELNQLGSAISEYEGSRHSVKPEPRKDAMTMPFGKYKGCYVEDIFTDISHTKWCLKQGFVQYDYPELHHHLQTLYDTIKESVENTMYLYCLVLSNNQGVKIGKTKQYIPKRLYDYVCLSNNYSQSFKKNPIDIKKSFVFKTNDLGIEKELKKTFKPFLLHGFELFDVDFSCVENEVIKKSKGNGKFFYYKKPLVDFIPYDNLQDLRKDFVIYVDRHVNFRGEYESHLRKKGLYQFYNPDFVGGNLN